MNSARLRALLVVQAALVQACVFVPRTVQIGDSRCQSVARHMQLEVVQIAAIHHCVNEGCAALVIAAGVTAAASLIVSGSIVLVGNVAYWLERSTQCQPVR